MKKYYVLLAGAILAATIETQAQTKIGGSGAPDSSAMLEVTGGTSNNKGILLPRISLTNVATWGLNGSTPVAGMFVYNTNASVTGGSGVGTYYWDGTQWVKSTSAAVSGWNLTGNAGTNLATDFVGTTDAQPLVLRTNSAEHMRITAGGNVGINNGAPLSPLSFASTQGPKVALYDNGSATEHYGLGVSGGLLNYQVMTGATHSFRTGGKNADGTELMRIQSDGNVGIGTSVPLAPLSFASTDEPKIALYDNGSTTQHYGLGVSGAQLNYQIMNGGTHSFRAGGKNADGTELMRIQSNGNVGVGTAVPAAKLDVNGTARINGSAGTPTTITGRSAAGDIGNVAIGTGLSLNGGTLSATAPTPGWGLNGNTGTNFTTDYIGTTDAQPLVMRTNAAEHMRITADGNVGINNGAPLAPLSFASTTTPKISLYDNGSTTEHYGLGVSGGQLNYQVMASAAHSFRIGGKNEDGTELMRIQSDGNVGIGTSTPTSKLDVAGTARIQGSAGTPTAITGRDAFGNINNITLGANLSLAGGVLSASGGGTTGWGLNGNAGTNFATDFVGTTDAQPLVLRTNSAEHLRITADGKIGINNGAPVATLDVVGSARITTSLGTPTAITGRDASGNIGDITLGTNLSLTGGTLNATVPAAGWGLTGNAGTNPATNFIGTTNAQPLAFRTNGTEKVRIGTDGYMGIGANAPGSRLHMVSDGLGGGTTDDILLASYGPTATSVLPTFFFQASTGTAASPGNTANNTQMGSVRFNAIVGGTVASQSGIASNYTGNGNTHGANLTFMTAQAGSAFVERMIIESTGNVGIGTTNPAYNLDVAGDINASANVRAGGVVLTSDARLKRNIINSNFGLNTIMDLRPVVYDKKSSIKATNYDRHEIGFIAQEVAKVLPSIVTEGKDADKTLAVSYTELIPVLTKAIQELNTQVETLKAENAQLKDNKAVTAQLMERVKQMEQMIGIKEIEGTSKVAGK